MQYRTPNVTMILPEATQALEQAKPYQSRPREPGIACVGHRGTKVQRHPPEGVCMSVLRRLQAHTAMLVIAGVWLLGATPASAAGGTGIGSGRLVPTVAAVVGLIGVVLGGRALARSAGRIGTGNGRRGAIAALMVGLISVVVGGQHLARAPGAFGTGSGRLGAIVALVLGLIGMVLGGLALARSRRTG